MAASSKGSKKPVSKDDLRRLMREKKVTQQTAKKKIDSPLAKYNSIGQLVCVVCNSQIKSELLWNAHIQGRTHKENVTALKLRNEAKNTPSVALPPGSLKRAHPGGSADNSAKHAKLASNGSGSSTKGVPADFFDKEKVGEGGTGLGLGGYESSDEEMEVDNTSSNNQASTTAPKTDTPGLPADFFDPGISAKPSKPATEEVKPEVSMAEKLPEGFFDDPKQDAKVRKVEYRDKLDDEWELFQKAMKEEATISEAIQEEDDEALISERNINEIDEQIHRWSKVDNLAKKKEELMSKDSQVGRKEDGSGSDSDIDEEEFDQLLHWRTKLIGKKGEKS